MSTYTRVQHIQGQLGLDPLGCEKQMIKSGTNFRTVSFYRSVDVSAPSQGTSPATVAATVSVRLGVLPVGTYFLKFGVGIVPTALFAAIVGLHDHSDTAGMSGALVKGTGCLWTILGLYTVQVENGNFQMSLNDLSQCHSPERYGPSGAMVLGVVTQSSFFGKTFTTDGTRDLYLSFTGVGIASVASTLRGNVQVMSYSDAEEES